MDWIEAVRVFDARIAPHLWILAILGLLAWCGAAFGMFRLTRGGPAQRVSGGRILSVSVPLFALFVGSGAVMSLGERAAAISLLNASLRSPGVVVRVDGQSCDNPRALLDALSRLDDDHPSHSGPVGRVMKVTLSTASGSADLLLAKDNKDDRNWWVFFPGLSMTGHVGPAGEIGHVRADDQACFFAPQEPV